MGNLSKNLSRWEIACKCGCGFDSMDIETINVIQECCDNFASKLGKAKVVLVVHSGCRCFAWNDHVGGEDGSKHLIARAIDFHIEGVPNGEVYKYLDKKYIAKYGIGLYSWGVHLDTRTGRSKRWWKSNPV